MSWFVAQRRCESCEFTERLEKSALANWLKSCGRMKRDAKPEVPLMMELGKLDAAAASCPQCGAVGLVLEPPADEDEADWGDARRCYPGDAAGTSGGNSPVGGILKARAMTQIRPCSP